MCALRELKITTEVFEIPLQTEEKKSLTFDLGIRLEYVTVLVSDIAHVFVTK